MADQKELVIPVVGDLLLADVDGAKGAGEVFPTGGVEVAGRFIEEGDSRADGLQHRQAQGDYRAHGLAAGELIIAPFTEFAIDHVAQHNTVILAPGKLLIDLGDDPVDAIGPLTDLFTEALGQVAGDVAEHPVAQELDQRFLLAVGLDLCLLDSDLFFDLFEIVDLRGQPLHLFFEPFNLLAEGTDFAAELVFPGTQLLVL